MSEHHISNTFQHVKQAYSDLVYLFACTLPEHWENPSIRVHKRPKSDQTISEPWMLKKPSPTKLRHSWRQKIDSGNDHLHLCQPVTPIDKMNTVKNWHDGRICTHMPKCVINSSPTPTCPSTVPRGAILFLLVAAWWDAVLLVPQNRSQRLVSFLAAVSLRCRDALPESYAK